jgi:hypothetical protein
MNMQINSAINLFRITIIVLLLGLTPAMPAAEKLKALIVDGQNNHKVWPKSTVMMKQYLFHTTLGHDTEAFEGVGFITTFLRGTEWAATGKVTQKIPADFPSADKTSARPFQPANAK